MQHPFSILIQMMRRKHATSPRIRTISWGMALAMILSGSFTAAWGTDLDVTSYGVVGDGTTDDSTNFQIALDAAATAGLTDPSARLVIPDHFTIRITKNLYLHGNHDLVGAGVHSIILCDADLNLDMGRQYWISVGITEHRNNSGSMDTYTGTISDLCFKVSANGKFQRALFIFSGSNVVIQDNLFDWNSGVSGTDFGLFGALSSGNNNTWAPNGIPIRDSFTIQRNQIQARHSADGSEGFGVGNATLVTIKDNTIMGVGDDPIGCHSVVGLTIENNTCYSIDGRILANSCRDVLIQNNYAQRIADPNGNWVGGGALLMAGLEGVSSYAPENIQILNNVLVIPQPIAAFTYGIRMLGVRNATLSGNSILMHAASGGGGISIEPDLTTPTWFDPTGIEFDSIARPRNTTVDNNQCRGAYPGAIRQSGNVNDLIGPFTLEGNRAGSYSWYSDTTLFNRHNLQINDDFAKEQISLTAVSNPVNIIDFSLPNLNGGNTLSSSIYTVARSGKLLGYDVTFTPEITSGGITLKVLKNGVQIASAFMGTSKQIQFSRIDTNFLITTGDTIQTQVVAQASLLPANINVQISMKSLEKGELSAKWSLDENTGSVATDSSAHGHVMTLPGSATWIPGVNGSAVNFALSSYATVPDHASLDISDTLTVAFWMKLNTLPTSSYVYPIQKYMGTSDANFICYYKKATKQLFFYANAGGTWQLISDPQVLPVGQWVHVCLTYTSVSGGQLYLDGVPSGIKKGSGLLATNAADLKLGGFDGSMDEVHLCDRCLTQQEIKALAVWPSLVGAWALDETSNSIATDSSGQSNDGVLDSGVHWSTGVDHGAATVVAGQYITVPDHASLDVADQLTVAFWMKSDWIPTSRRYPIGKQNGTFDANFMCHYKEGTGQLFFYATAGGTWQLITDLCELPINTWVHVCLVYDSTLGGQLYLNGQPCGVRKGSGLLSTNNASLKIGGYDGKIDDVKIFHKALSNAEVLDLLVQ